MYSVAFSWSLGNSRWALALRLRTVAGSAAWAGASWLSSRVTPNSKGREERRNRDMMGPFAVKTAL
ncbi:hypothetical protein D3C78_1504310 [compost metagenome]